MPDIQPKFNYIVFDFDGTLADTFYTVIQFVRSKSTEWGIPELTDDKLAQYRNLRPQDALKVLGIPPYKLPFIVFAIRKYLRANVESIQPIDGIALMIKELKKRGYKLGVLTTSISATVKRFLDKHSIEGIDFIYSNSSIFGKDKSMKKMLKDLSINPSEVVYVGDETRDIEAAKKVGLAVMSVTWGFQGKEILQKLEPDFVVDSPKELLDKLP